MPTEGRFSLSRRRFLEAAAIAGAAAPWVGAAASRSLAATAGGEKARIGVIGVGVRGRALILHMQQLANTEIVAVCDDYEPHFERAQLLTQGKAAAFRDHRALLDMEGLDAVVIATPLHEHARRTIDALDAGLHVMCEKAMARTLDDCKAMVDAAARTGLILQIGHQRLFNVVYLNALERARAGEIGEINQIRAYWHRNNDWRREAPPGGGAALERKLNWRLYREYSAGLMTELASHQIQVANWFFDAVPERVMGSGSICFWRDGREVYDQVALIYDYSDGRKLIYDSFIANKHYGLEEQIMGHLGTIEPEVNRIYAENPPPAPGILQLGHDIRQGLFEATPIGGGSWTPETAATYAGEPLGWSQYEDTHLQMEAFADAVMRGEPYPNLLREGYHASIASLLGEQAMDSGQPVEWPREHVMPREAQLAETRA
ncbi:MAG: Gfo/Idh/MocA family oxidoreductase [Caulobacterales bacterium]|nr:Gfo/Idh/MocA family oxidoreductase [Caulobacterales bacterium]